MTASTCKNCARVCVSLLQFDDLVIELQGILGPALELYDVGHLRVDHCQLSVHILLRHILQNTRRD